MIWGVSYIHVALFMKAFLLSFN